MLAGISDEGPLPSQVQGDNIGKNRDVQDFNSKLMGCLYITTTMFFLTKYGL